MKSMAEEGWSSGKCNYDSHWDNMGDGLASFMGNTNSAEHSHNSGTYGNSNQGWKFKTQASQHLYVSLSQRLIYWS